MRPQSPRASRVLHLARPPAATGRQKQNVNMRMPMRMCDACACPSQGLSPTQLTDSGPLHREATHLSARPSARGSTRQRFGAMWPRALAGACAAHGGGRVGANDALMEVRAPPTTHGHGHGWERCGVCISAPSCPHGGSRAAARQQAAGSRQQADEALMRYAHTAGRSRPVSRAGTLATRSKLATGSDPSKRSNRAPAICPCASAVTWRLHGGYMAVTWPSHGRYVAVTSAPALRRLASPPPSARANGRAARLTPAGNGRQR